MSLNIKKTLTKLKYIAKLIKIIKMKKKKIMIPTNAQRLNNTNQKQTNKKKKNDLIMNVKKTQKILNRNNV